MGGFVSKYVFIPPQCTYTDKSPYPVTFIKTRSGKEIPSYFIPARSSNTKTTILYSHGNAADIGAMFDFLHFLNTYLPVNIMHYEYIGYGLAKTQGAPSEQGAYESIEAAVDYLKLTHDIDISNVIIFGTSVGGGPSIHLASKPFVYRNEPASSGRYCKGLILECTFTSCCRVVMSERATLFVRPVDMFLNVNKISSVKCPVIIFHGTKDSVVPFEHGEELWRRLHDDFKFRNVWVENADHHSIIPTLSHRIYIQHLKEFLEHCQTFVPPPSLNSQKPPRKRTKFTPSLSISNPSDSSGVDFETYMNLPKKSTSDNSSPSSEQ